MNELSMTLNVRREYKPNEKKITIDVSPKSKTHTPKSNFEKNFNNSNSNVQEFNL